LSRNINKVCLEHIMAWKHLSNSLVEQKWIPPPPSSWLKINFDTTIRDTYSAQAAVCHNHYGHIIKMNSQISLMCLPNMGEALASRLTTSLASSLNTKRFIIEGDSKIVILALQQPSRLMNLLYYISIILLTPSQLTPRGQGDLICCI
jgi:hypothetical protein